VLEERLCQLSSLYGTLILPKLGLRAVWWLNQFWAPGAQNTKNFFSENYFFQYSYDVKMRLSAKCASMESRDSYQIRAECILIHILCPFEAPDAQFGHQTALHPKNQQKF